MKTDCDVIADLMPLYADKLCSEKSRELIEEHCKECDICKRRLDAISVPLPDMKTGGGAKNPFKKTKRHYLKLAFFTALICTFISVLAYKPVKLSISEITKSRDESWTSAAAEKEMKNFGKLLKNGQYEKALSSVGIVALDKSGIFLGDEENADIRDIYAKIFSGFIENYPIKDIDCSARYSGTQMKGELHLILDEKNISAPVEIYFQFERREDGRDYISQAILNNYSAAKSCREEEILSKLRDMYGIFIIPDYPANHITDRLDSVISGDGLKSDGNDGVIITSRQKELQREEHEIMNNYLISKGEYYEPDYENEDLKREMAERNKRYNEYKSHYESLAKSIFCEKYRYVSVQGERPYFVKEKYLDGSPYAYENNCCFRQKITVNMETQEGTAFYVSFDARVGFYADTPFKDVTFSENTPQEFIDGFNELFN